VPVIGFGTQTWPTGAPPHSWGAAGTSGLSLGVKAATLAARVIALSVATLLQDLATLQLARVELDKRRRGRRPCGPLR